MRVIALKTKKGDDILGYYAGDMTMAFNDERAMVLLRPVKIDTVFTPGPNGLKTIYVPSLYFPFIDTAFPIPVSSIVQQGMANPFFTKLYKSVVSELIVAEDDRQAEIINAINIKEAEALMPPNTTLVYSDTTYMQ